MCVNVLIWLLKCKVDATQKAILFILFMCRYRVCKVFLYMVGSVCTVYTSLYYIWWGRSTQVYIIYGGVGLHSIHKSLLYMVGSVYTVYTSLYYIWWGRSAQYTQVYYIWWGRSAQYAQVFIIYGGVGLLNIHKSLLYMVGSVCTCLYYIWWGRSTQVFIIYGGVGLHKSLLYMVGSVYTSLYYIWWGRSTLYTQVYIIYGGVGLHQSLLYMVGSIYTVYTSLYYIWGHTDVPKSCIVMWGRCENPLSSVLPGVHIPLHPPEIGLASPLAEKEYWVSMWTIIEVYLIYPNTTSHIARPMLLIPDTTNPTARPMFSIPT